MNVIKFNDFKINESDDYTFNPDLVNKKRLWYSFDANEIVKVSTNIIDLIQNAYEKTTDGSFVNNKEDILKSSVWIAIDWDEFPDADAVIFGRKSDFGIKIQGIGHDGDPKSKEMLMDKFISVLKLDGYWVESSGKVEEIFYNKNVPYVTSEEKLNLMFPNSNLKLINEKGKYERELNTGKIIKQTVFGKPKF